MDIGLQIVCLHCSDLSTLFYLFTGLCPFTVSTQASTRLEYDLLPGVWLPFGKVTLLV